MAYTRSHSMLMRDFQHSLPMVLLRAREGAMRLFRPLLRAHGFTEQQWRVMRVLMENDGVYISTLAQSCMLLPPSISRIVRSLENDGLVRRRVVQHKMCRFRLYTTAAGRQRFSRAAPDMECCYKQIMHCIGVCNLNALYNLLDELQSALDTIAVVGPGGDQVREHKS